MAIFYKRPVNSTSRSISTSLIMPWSLIVSGIASCGWPCMNWELVPDHLIKLISNLYDGQQTCVHTAEGDSDLFKTGQGVRQRCILSPTLFNLYTEYIMRHALVDWDRGLSVGGHRISNLRYVVVITPLASNWIDLKDHLLRVKAESEALDLRLNVSKTKIMIIGCDGNIEPFLVGGTEVEQVTQFNFLGSLITTSGGCSAEISRCLAMTKSRGGGGTQLFSGRVYGPDFRSVGLANWHLPLKRGACERKISKFGACELKISKFGGLWAKIWVKIEAVEAKISKFSQKGVLWTDSFAWNGTLASGRRGVKRGSSGPHIPIPPF